MSRVLNANNCTLDTFRSVLGKVNDGDVVFNAEGTGVKKVNYGRIIKHEKTVGDANANRQVRQALYNAVVSSVESRGLKPETMAWIRTQLGIGGDGIATEGTLLKRRTVKAVLDRVDSNDQAFREGMLVTNECRKIANRLPATAWSSLTVAMAALNDPRYFRDPKAMAGLLPPEGLSGRTPQELARFVKDNHRVLEVLALDHLYKAARDSGCESLDGTQVKAAFRAAVEQLMGAYGKGEPPCTFSDVLAKSVPPTFENEAQKMQFFERFKRVGGVEFDDALVQLKRLAADAKMPPDRALKFDWAMDFLRSEFRNAVNNPAKEDGALSKQAANMREWVESLLLLCLDAGGCPKLLDDLMKKVTDALVGLPKGENGPTAKSVLQALQTTFSELFGKFSLRNLVRTALAGGHPLPGMDFDQTVDYMYNEIRDKCWTNGDAPTQDAMCRFFGNVLAEAYAATASDAPVATVPTDLKDCLDALVTNHYSLVLAAPKLPKKIEAPDEQGEKERYARADVANFEDTVKRLAKRLDELKGLENGLDPNRAMVLRRALDTFVKDFRDAYKTSSDRLSELQSLVTDLSDYLGILDVLRQYNDKKGTDNEVARLTQLADQIVAAAGGIGKSLSAENTSTVLRESFDKVIGPLLRAGSLRAAIREALGKIGAEETADVFKELVNRDPKFVAEQILDIYRKYDGKSESVSVPVALASELQSAEDDFKDLLPESKAVAVPFDDKLVKASYADCGGESIDSAVNALKKFFSAYRECPRHDVLNSAFETVRMDFRSRYNNNLVIVNANGGNIEDQALMMKRDHALDAAAGKELAKIAEEIDAVKNLVPRGMIYGLVRSLTDGIKQAVDAGKTDAGTLLTVLKKGLGDFTARFSLRAIVRAALTGVNLPKGYDLNGWTDKLVDRIVGKTLTGTEDAKKAASQHIREQLVYAFENGGAGDTAVQDDFKSELLDMCVTIAAEEEAAKAKRAEDEAYVGRQVQEVGGMRQVQGENAGTRTMRCLRLLAKMIYGSTFEGLTEKELVDHLVAAGKQRLDFAVACIRARVDTADSMIADAYKRPGFTPIRDYLLDSGADPATVSPAAVYTLSRILVNGLPQNGLPFREFFGDFKGDSTSDVRMHRLMTAAVKVAGIDLSATLKEKGVSSGCFDIDEFVRRDPAAKGSEHLGLATFVSFFTPSYPDSLANIPPVTQLDTAELLTTFARMGIGLEQFASFEGRERIATLLFLASKNPTGLVGLSEFCQRLTGKRPTEVRLVDFAEAFLGRAGAKTDPAEKLGPDAKRLADALLGKLRLSEAGLTLDAKLGLRAAAMRLRDAPSGTSVEVKLNGRGVTLTALGGGRLDARIDGCVLPVGETADGIVRMAEDVIVAEVSPDKGYQPGNNKILEMLQRFPAPGKGISVMRARELYAKALSLRTKLPVVTFSTLKLDDLRSLAIVALGGTEAGGLTPVQMAGKLRELGGRPPLTYVSTDILEAHQALEKDKVNGVDVNATVKIQPMSPPRLISERRTETLPKDVRNLAADMLMNADTWQIDEMTLEGSGQQQEQRGERLKRLLKSYGPELANIRKDEMLLDSIPEFVRADMKDIILEAAKLDLDDGKSAAKLEALEKRLEDLSSKAMDELQGKVNKMFQGTDGDKRDVWRKTFGEITGAEGLNKDNPAGAFALKVLHGYFEKSGMMDKRKMLSAVVRQDYSKYDQPERREAMLVAELLKGAGPLLQKILQGLPAESFNKETQLALKDMKSRLPPIPEDAVQAQLYELVKSSGGKILSIEVMKSLGAASVGQAFLCNVKTPEHPVLGVDCVIKVLRPNAQTSICREKALIDDLVGTDPALRRMFGQQYANVLKELDFTLEAANVDLGAINYEQPYVPVETEEAQDAAFNTEEVAVAAGKKVANKVGDHLTNFFGFLGVTEGKKQNPLDKTLEESPFQPKMPEDNDKEKHKHHDVHSMKRLGEIPATTGTMVVRKAPGRTIDGEIRNTNEEIGKRLGNFTDKSGSLDINGGGFMRRHESNDPVTYFSFQMLVNDKRDMLLACRRKMADVVDAWLDQALFGDGFFHGDMHEGNLMFDGSGVTVIDYGNCSRLTLHEQNLLRMLMVQAMLGDTDGFSKILSAEFGKNFKQTADLTSELNQVLNKGTPGDILMRLHGALTILQNHRVPLPGNVNAFIQSFVRLNGVVSALDDELMTLEDHSSCTRYSAGWFQDLKFPLQNGPKQNVVPVLFKAIEDVLALQLPVTTAMQDEKFADFEELRFKANFAQDLEALGPELMDAVVKKLDAFAEGIGLTEEQRAGFRDNARILASLDKSAENYKAEHEKYLGYLDSTFRSLVTNIQCALNKLDPSVSASSGHALNSRDMPSFADIIADTVLHRTVRLAQVIFNVLDTVDDIKSTAARMGDAQKLAAKIANGVKDVKTAFYEKNGELPAEKALAPLTILHIEKAAKDFCAPVDRPYRKPNWAQDAELRKSTLAILADDLGRLRKSVGAEPTETMIRYAFDLNDLYEGVLEKSKTGGMILKASGLAAAIRDLSEDDYNALLVAAQQEKNETLVTCLDVLRLKG